MDGSLKIERSNWSTDNIIWTSTQNGITVLNTTKDASGKPTGSVLSTHSSKDGVESTSTVVRNAEGELMNSARPPRRPCPTAARSMRSRPPR